MIQLGKGAKCIVEIDNVQYRARIEKVYTNVLGNVIDYDVALFHITDYKHEGCPSFDIVKPSMIIS